MKIIKEKASSRGVVSSFSRDALEEFAPAPAIEIDGLESAVELPPSLDDLSPREIEELRAEALAQAEAEADAIRAQAREAGFEQGYAEAQERFRAETATSISALEQALERIEAQYEAFIAQTTPEICALLAHMAREILQREAHTDSALIARVVDKGLRQIGEAPSVTIHLHPDDRDGLAELIAQAPQSHPGIGALNFIANPEISRGGALIDTPELHVDARIERLIHEFVQVLEG